MTARLINPKTIEVVFDDWRYVRIYCRESLDAGDIHDPVRCGTLYDTHPEFTSVLVEDPRGRLIIPAKLVESPAIGLFYQAVGNGFLLSETETKQTRPVFFCDRIIYVLKEFQFLKTTSKGFNVYRALVEASKQKGGAVGTYRMIAFQHISFS